MAKASGRCRIGLDFEFPGHPFSSLSDIQEFFDGHSFVSEEEGHRGRDNDFFDRDEEEGESPCINGTEEKQEVILCRSTSTETRIRNSTREVLREIEATRPLCLCGRTIGDCRCCLMGEVCSRLCGSGCNVVICKSKWRSSSCIPLGEHTFLDVVDSSSSKIGEMRVILELDVVFVGKVERLQGVIKVVCSAANKCGKEKGMHMGPWRKQRYMQAKWLDSCRRTIPVLARPSIDLARPPSRTRDSMLTRDLLENLPPLMQCKADAV